MVELHEFLLTISTTGPEEGAECERVWNEFEEFNANPARSGEVICGVAQVPADLVLSVLDSVAEAVSKGNTHELSILVQFGFWLGQRAALTKSIESVH